MTDENRQKLLSVLDETCVCTDQTIARAILGEPSGMLPWLYGYFSTLERPMSPREFFDFWTSMDRWQQDEYLMFAFINMP
jgi:hypothetical protein